ncbi:reverse transcriptase domain-containing protein [Tanacetum coccineum]
MSRSTKDSSHRRKEARNLIRSYVTCFSERQREIKREWDTSDRANHRQPVRTEKTYLSENEHDQGEHWKYKKQRSTNEEVLSQSWLCEETDPFTARIHNGKIKRWAMPTWCHMFNSTLISSARVWFDKLPPESIDSYEIMRKAFLGNFSQQKKYIKDPVEIHHIKQKEGESTKAIMEHFKAESMNVNGALECIRISRFMHGITNPDLIKRLNDNISMFVDEMMSVTTAFLQGEVAVANQSRKKAPLAWKHHEASYKPSFDKRIDFKNWHKSNKMQDRFTPLLKTLKENPSNRNADNKAKSPSKLLNKSRNLLPTPREQWVQESPIVIKAKVEGHLIHRMYVDGGSALEVLYEHCFNRLHLEVKSRMIQATTLLLGFSGVPSTAHGLLKFPIGEGIVTLRSNTTTPTECKIVAEAPNKSLPNEPMVAEGIKVAIHPKYPEQTVTIGESLSEKGKMELYDLLRSNLDIFVWKPSDMTGVPRSIAEHLLNVHEGWPPIRQKRRGLAPD